MNTSMDPTKPDRASIVTAPEPRAPGAFASGAFVIRAEPLVVETSDRVELVDLTERVAALVRTSGIREGVASMWSLHTTCALFINETQAALHADIKRLLEGMVARDGAWMHNDPSHSDCDRMNADSHLRAMLLGHSVTAQVTSGALVLGQWQRILAAELDGPRTRTLRLQVMGIA
jgi:secondary thiamine-phosphate synthase enzyme